MHILLLVLKIIGIVLLVLLISAVCLLAMALFIPVRYRLAAYFGESNKKGQEKGEGYSVSLKAGWLFGTLSASFGYPSCDWAVRLFGIPIKKSKKKDHGRDEIRRKEGGGQAGSQGGRKISQDTAKDGKKEKGDRKKEQGKRGAGGRLRAIRKNIAGRRDAARDIAGRLKAYYRILLDPENREAYRFIKSTLSSFIKHILPKKIRADMVIGLSDPAATGLLFGGLGIATSFIEGDYSLSPDFYNERIDGDICVKGRIRLVIAAYHIIRVAVNSDIKKVAGQFKKIR